jgi:hypothetical protein
MKIALLVLLIWLYACNDAGESKPEIKQDSMPLNKNSPITVPMQNKAFPDTSGKKLASSAPKKEFVFSYKNDSLEQQMKVVKINKNLMTFRLITSNTRRGSVIPSGAGLPMMIREVMRRTMLMTDMDFSMIIGILRTKRPAV